MKKDDVINESSIDDLIKYSEEDGDTPEDDFNVEDLPEADNTEEKPAADTIAGIAEEYEDYFEDELVFDNDKRNTRLGIIIGAVIGLAAIIAFFSIDSGIVGSYKNNFANNFSRIFANFKPDNTIPEEKETKVTAHQYRTEAKSSAVISPENAAEAEYTPYKNGIICAVTNHMTYIGYDGSIIWEADTAVVDPILSAEGNYIMLAERNRNKICLYSDKKLLYDVDDADAIKTAKVSANGDVVAVTDKASYKGGISVYNKTGAQIYSWASGGDAVISADISSSSRRIAVALLNTETKAESAIQLFDINKEESYSRIFIENTVIFDLVFSGSTLSAFGDNRIVTVSDKGRVLANVTLDEVELVHSAIDDDGNKLLSFNDGNVPMINLYSRRGSLKASESLRGVAGFIDINKKNIIYNIGRDIYFGKINSKNIAKYTATMDIKKLMIVSDETFVIVYSNSIEIVNI